MPLTERPPNISLINLETLDTFEVDGRGVLIPEKVTQKTVVKFARISPFGMSHSRLQYTGTENRIVQQLAFRLVVQTVAENERAKDFVRFILSFGYAMGDPTEPLDAGTPLMTLVWPGVMSGTFRVLEIMTEETNFNKLGETVDGVVTVNLIEYLERRLTHEDVRARGPFRVKLV